MSHPARFSGPFQLGDRVQLTGPKGRRNSITLEAGGEFHTHRGVVLHDSLIGQDDGSVVTSTTGIQYLALRPLLTDFVMAMPRGAAIIYPKDAAQILALADVFPGATVVEAGVGSGALSLWLLRALAGQGRLLSFERRSEFAEIAKANVATYFGSVPEQWQLPIGDLNEALPEHLGAGEADRVILDMLAPWECLEACATALKPGGILLGYVATVTQLSRLVEAMRDTGAFTEPDASETMVRGWHVEGLAVRPDHRMVAHTAFLVTARRLAPGAVLPELKRRASKSEYSDEDVELWTPGAVGDRPLSEKKLRKTMRLTGEAAQTARRRLESAPDAAAPDPAPGSAAAAAADDGERPR